MEKQTARSIVLGILSGIILGLVPTIVWASTACPNQLTEIAYSATFPAATLGNAPTGSRGETLKIQLGKVNKSGAKHQIIAQIWSETSSNSGGKKCQAICQIKSFESEYPYKPVSMDMTCQSTHFAPLNTPATLLWAQSSGQTTATLRFGTWLEGYRQAALKVETDRYSEAGHLIPTQVNQIKMITSAR